jgi:ABC-2 type transport system permease protein
MSRAVFALAVRQRFMTATLAALGMFAVIVMVGALFPSVGDSIGKLNVPKGVSNLLGGAEYSSLTGWMRSEIGAIYGPLVVGATAIAAACASTAGEEEGRILALVLAYPIERGRLLVAKAGAVEIVVVIVAAGTWLGLLVGVAVAGGGISTSHVTALALQLAFFGFTLGALALALAGTTGRKTIAAAGAGTFGVLGFLINGFAPLVAGLDWLKYLSPFYYYSGNDPLTNGIDWTGLIVLGLATVGFTAIGVAGFRRRDLRA